MPVGEAEWDVISGVSVGGINACGLGVYAPGEEEAATDFMLDFWRGMSRTTVYRKWDTGYIDGIFRKSGLFNNTHFIDYIESKMPADRRAMLRKMVVGSTDLNTGKYVRYTESLPYEEFTYKATRASSSFPVGFPTVEFDGNVLSDGGAILNLDISAAVHRCMRLLTTRRTS